MPVVTEFVTLQADFVTHFAQKIRGNNSLR
jgi:hypothetical protein